MTLSSTNQIFQAHDKYRDTILKDYFEFLRFQSVSSEEEFNNETIACAKWLVNYLQKSSFEAELIQTAEHPIVFGSNMSAGPDKPTLLIYGHYDVQPIDPIEEWKSPPFEPTIKDGNVFARGAQDDKGQIFFALCAIKAHLDEGHLLPINIKVLLEGDEERGSGGLHNVLPTISEKIRSDYLAVIDVGFDSINEPTVTIGVRGIVTMTVEAIGSKTDLHSGLFGGIAYNPNRALCEILASLYDDSGRVTVPGFYDKVKTPDNSELVNLKQDIALKEMKEQLGLLPTGGEKDVSPLFSNTLRPTLEINGIGGGYTGAGFKTVIPAKSIAKISCRLVPNQNPLEISTLVSQHIKSLAPEGIRVDVSIHSGSGRAFRSNPNSKIGRAAVRAFSDITGLECKFALDGASIPITPELVNASGADAVLIGYGLNSDQIHAPNEHFGLDRFRLGFATIYRLIELLGDEHTS